LGPGGVAAVAVGKKCDSVSEWGEECGELNREYESLYYIVTPLEMRMERLMERMGIIRFEKMKLMGLVDFKEEDLPL
jgi:hypothetical protein